MNIISFYPPSTSPQPSHAHVEHNKEMNILQPHLHHIHSVTYFQSLNKFKIIHKL